MSLGSDSCLKVCLCIVRTEIHKQGSAIPGSHMGTSGDTGRRNPAFGGWGGGGWAFLVSLAVSTAAEAVIISHPDSSSTNCLAGSPLEINKNQFSKRRLSPCFPRLAGRF